MSASREAGRGHLSEAARLIVPRPGDPHGPLPPLLLVLTIVTGLVDAFSYLSLGRVLVANMTGNVVFLGFAVGGAPDFTWWALLLAVGVFIAGASLGGRLVARLGSHRGRLLCAAAAIESTALALAWIASLVGPEPYHGGSLAVLIGFLGLALGLQNAAARFLQVPDLTTSVLTLTLTGIAADAKSSSGTRLGRRAVPVLTMFLGGAAGAALVMHGFGSVGLALCVALTALVAVAAGLTSRSAAGWTRGRPATGAQVQPERRRGRRSL